MKVLIAHSFRYIVSLVTVGFISSPFSAFAQSQGDLSFHVNSLIKVHTIRELLVAILNIFIVVATPIIVLFIIYAGFLYVTARGNVEQTQKATRALTYAIIGGVIVLGSVALSGIIESTVSSFYQ